MTLRITKGASGYHVSRKRSLLTFPSRSIYVELADQYKDMDPVSNVRKRNMLAQHLHEVVDTMEQKVRVHHCFTLMRAPNRVIRETRLRNYIVC